MKKKLLLILYIVAILICGRFCLSYFYNQYVLDEYKNGNYSINEDLLLTLNFMEPYIVHYNNANILYQNMLYDDAISEYEKTLSYDSLPSDRECKVRINMALCYVAMLPQDYDSIDNIDDSIDNLYNALDVLSENECAVEGGGGHSSRAQHLYDELQDRIEALEYYRDNHPDRIVNHIEIDKSFENAENTSSLVATFVLRYGAINGSDIATLQREGNVYSYDGVLSAGVYYLMETETPEGFFSIDPIEITVDDEKNITVRETPENIAAAISEDNHGVVLSIVNLAIPTPAINNITVNKSFQEPEDEDVPTGDDPAETTAPVELIAAFEIRQGAANGPIIAVLERNGNMYSFTGHLDEGVYYLIETETPEGYVPMPPVRFSVDIAGVITLGELPPIVTAVLSADGVDAVFDVYNILESSMSPSPSNPSDPSDPSDPSETTDSSEPSETSDSSGTSEGSETTELTTNFTDFESSIHTIIDSLDTNAESMRGSEISEPDPYGGNWYINPGCW